MAAEVKGAKLSVKVQAYPCTFYLNHFTFNQSNVEPHFEPKK